MKPGDTYMYNNRYSISFRTITEVEKNEVVHYYYKEIGSFGRYNISGTTCCTLSQFKAGNTIKVNRFFKKLYDIS